MIDAAGTEIDALMFNGSIPGPLIICHECDYVELTLTNPDGTVKLSRTLGFWRRNRSAVERRINNLGSGQGAE